ncbi:NU3M oxidoreductase, partial [Acromyrmex insinuator]
INYKNYIIYYYMICPIFYSIFNNFIISKKTNFNQEKISLFECGFNPISRIRLPFRSQFFIISLILLIFLYIHNFNPFTIFYSFIFLFILIISLYIEYNEYSFD